MAEITFNVAQFRMTFSAFADPAKYTDAELNGCWDQATCMVSTTPSCRLQEKCRTQGLQLLTAHICTLQTQIQDGTNTGVTTSATIDKVSVTLQPPPTTNGWNWWLSTTPYGSQLWALLKVNSVGGFYIGGLPERSAFRKVGGIF